MKKKKLPLFYIIYFSLLALFIVALITGCILLRNFIKEYNEGISETVSERFFEENFVSLNVDKIITMSGITPCEFENEDDIHDFVTEKLTENKLTYTSVSSLSEDDTKKYIVKSGDYKIASFTLKPDKNGDYTEDTLILHLPKNLHKEFKILNTSTLYVNGVEVSDEYITASEPHESADFLPEYTTKPMWVTYSITGLTKEPEYTVIDRNGITPVLTESNGIIIEQISYDNPEEELASYLLEAAKQYAMCMQNDASKASVLKYFKPGTDLYSSIRSAENTFVWEHSGYSFENEKVSEFFRYDENTVSVRISFIHILHKYGKEDYRDATDITYYAENTDGKYLIYARHNN